MQHFQAPMLAIGDDTLYTTFIHFSLTNHCHLVVKLLPTVAQDGIQVHGGPRQKSRKASDIPCTAVYDWWKDIYIYICMYNTMPQL